MTPDFAFNIPPTIVTTRFLFTDGHVIDVTHAHPDGSHVRTLVLDEAVRQWGADERRKIEGAARLPTEPTAASSTPRTKARKTTRPAAEE